MKQPHILEITKDMIAISRFSKGEAKKIFDEVNETGVKVVMKNGVPVCVLISPTDYEELLKKIEEGDE